MVINKWIIKLEILVKYLQIIVIVPLKLFNRSVKLFKELKERLLKKRKNKKFIKMERKLLELYVLREKKKLLLRREYIMIFSIKYVINIY